VSVRFRPAGAPAVSAVTAFTHDIGVGGAFIETDRPAEVGTALTLELDVPGPAGVIEIAAEVRWVAKAAQAGSGADAGAGAGPGSRGPGMGVKFGPLEVEALLALSDYFATLAGSGGGAGRS